MAESELQTGAGPAGALPFIYGHVDQDLFPIEQMRVAAELTLREHGRRALNYGPEQGCGALLTYLQSKLASDEGLEVGLDNLMLTVGASGGLDAVCRLFARPGDAVLVEAPSYHDALDVMRDYPVQIAAVPLDEGGVQIEALGERLERLKRDGIRTSLLYTIPSFQNPSGVTLGADRRPALLELARRHDLLIVEDEVYRDLAYGEPPPPSMYELDAADGGQTVIRLGSFSKILAPGLRLGWTIAAPGHITRLVGGGVTASGGGANPFVAYVSAAFCQRGWLEPHIALLRKVYQRRRDVMLAALEASMPDGVRWTRPDGGFYVWLTLPEPLRAKQILEEGHRHAITFLTGELFFAEGGGERNIRLPFSYIPPAEMEQGIYKLAELIRSQG